MGKDTHHDFVSLRFKFHDFYELFNRDFVIALREACVLICSQDTGHVLWFTSISLVILLSRQLGMQQQLRLLEHFVPLV